MTTQIYLYDFTLSADTNTQGDITEFCRKNCSRWVFQKEQSVGAHNYLHYQCRVSLTKKVRKNQMVILMRAANLKFAADAVSPTSKACADDAHAKFSYVTKEDTRVDGPWTDQKDRKWKNAGVRYIDSMGRDPWMDTIMEMLKVYDHRHINVLIDKKGNLGKTNFEDWLEFYDHAFALWYKLPMSYMMYEAYANPNHKCYTIGLARAIDKKDMKEFWTFIENLKDGRLSDDRYKAKRVRCERPHIWIFSNWVPEFYQQSHDRWRLWTVEDQELVPYEAPEAADGQLE